MSENAEKTHERFVAKVNAYLSNDENDEFDLEVVASMFEKFQQAHADNNEERTAVLVKRIKTFTAGTRVSVSLTEEQEAQIVEDANTFLSISDRYPNLSIPRERTFEKVQASMQKALKEAHKWSRFSASRTMMSDSSPSWGIFTPLLGIMGGGYVSWGVYRFTNFRS